MTVPSAIPTGNFTFSGSWSCTGAFGNGNIHKAVFAGENILGGKWIELREQDVEPATGYVAKYLIGYDPQQKSYVEFDANNFGAAVYRSEQGWTNGSLTMTSPVERDPKLPYAANRFVYGIKTDGAFTVDWQVSKTAAFNWVQSDHLECRRADATVPR